MSNLHKGNIIRAAEYSDINVRLEVIFAMQQYLLGYRPKTQYNAN